MMRPASFLLRPRHVSRNLYIKRRCVREGLRSFSQLNRRRAESGTTTSDGAKEQEKASLGSKAWAFVVGGGAALAYAMYKRRNNDTSIASSTDGFVKYTLVDKEAVSSTCSIFTISPRTASGPSLDGAQWQRSVTSVQLKQPQLQIARSYTILPAVPGQPANTVRFLIRQEEKGEVSTYLHKMPLGSEIEVRGPQVELTIPDNVKEVVFLAGGTGIAPALRTAAAIGGKAKVHVLWASRKREDCAGGVSDTVKSGGIWAALTSWTRSKAPMEQTTDGTVVNASAEKSTIVLMLDLLKRQIASEREGGAGNLTVDYFVDDESTLIHPKTVARLLATQSSSTDESQKDGVRLVIVSGPEGFIARWAGPKQFVNGKEGQGSLGGVLSTLDTKGWQVVKL